MATIRPVRRGKSSTVPKGAIWNLNAAFGMTNLFNMIHIGGVYGAASGDDNADLCVAAPREYYGTVSVEF